MSLASIVLARMFKLGDDKRDKGLTMPDTIHWYKGISYGPHGNSNILDVYRPKNVTNETKLPVIVNVHGGGYVYGSTKTYQFYCAQLAELGFAVVSFNYRLAPKYKFPTPIVDTDAVLQWIVKNAESYGFDLENICIVGDSAGAQIASQYCVMCTNPEYAEIMGIHPTGFKLVAAGLNCGVYDAWYAATEKSQNRTMMQDYFTKNPEQFGEKLKVLDYITADFPPTYLISAEGDFLKDFVKPMAELLTSKGVDVDYKIYGNENTGHVFHCDMRNEFSKQANTDETDFMKKHITK